MSSYERKRFAQLNDCAACHQADQPRWLDHGNVATLHRATDEHGFFVPQAVLSDVCAVADHRPRDLNADDPYVSVRCGELPAQLTHKNGRDRYSCPGGQLPLAHRDVRAGLAAGHAYTKRVCASRRWLYQRMTVRARDAFAGAFAACDIALSNQGSERADDH